MFGLAVKGEKSFADDRNRLGRNVVGMKYMGEHLGWGARVALPSTSTSYNFQLYPILFLMPKSMY